MKTNFKFLIILFILLIGCVCVGSTFAVDLSVADGDSIDNQINIIAHDDSSQKDVEINNLNDDDYGNFSELQEAIDNAGDTFTLNKNYMYVADDNLINGVVINKSITIDGNGYTINGSGLARAFNVNANNLTITNINFVDCHVSDTFSNGGAIYATNDVIVSAGVSFVNCTSGSGGYGGAIYACNDVIVSGFNISFVDCSSKYGGAIGAGMNVTVSGSSVSFENCFARYCGGAIDCGIVIINGSGVNFVDCSSVSVDGGAISCSIVIINGSGVSFVGCNCNEHEGGAINCDNLIINGSGVSFVDCSAYTGGAIYAWDDVIISGSGVSFVSCSAYTGGAIYATNVIISGFGVSFVDCSANSNGGAIYAHDGVTVNGPDVSFTNSNVAINDVSFTNSNVANDGPIASEGHVNINDVSFIGCSASNGGAIYLEGNNNIINNCSFINSTADKGSAIYVLFNSSLNIINCISNDEKAPIYNDGTILSPIMININGHKGTIVYGNILSLTATITTSGMKVAGGEFVFNVNNVKKTVKVNKYGFANVLYNKLGAGKYTVVASYSGNDVNDSFIIKQADPTINIDVKSNMNVSNIIEGDDVIVTVTLPKDATGTVRFSIDNGKHWVYVDIVNGTVQYTFKGLKTGKYTLLVEYSGDNNYNGASVETTFSIEELPMPVSKETMPNTGNPIIVLLIALCAIGLESFRRKL